MVLLDFQCLSFTAPAFGILTRCEMFTTVFFWYPLQLLAGHTSLDAFCCFQFRQKSCKLGRQAMALMFLMGVNRTKSGLEMPSSFWTSREKRTKRKCFAESSRHPLLTSSHTVPLSHTTLPHYHQMMVSDLKIWCPSENRLLQPLEIVHQSQWKNSALKR